MGSSVAGQSHPEFGVHTVEQYWPAFNSLRGPVGEGPTKHPNTPVVAKFILVDPVISKHQDLEKRSTVTVCHFFLINFCSVCSQEMESIE